MFCGVLKPSQSDKSKIEPFGLLSNRGAPHLRLFDANDKGVESLDVKNETIGISNSQITEPWPKVKLGVAALEEVVRAPPATEAELITQLEGILERDTFPHQDAMKDMDPDRVFAHLRKSVFIPKLKVHLPDGKDTFYGTRTNTIILVRKDGHVKYIERTLYDDKTFEPKPTESIFEFDIKGF